MLNPFFRLSTKDKMFFARHMAIMTRSGMQILDILRILQRQTQSKTFKTIIDTLIVSVKNGQFLSDGLEKHHAIFGDFFINIIKVGEISGTLAENLEYLAQSLAKNQELQSKIKGAMIYPIILLIVTLGMAGGLTYFIFPKILPIFTSLHVKLPLITRIFIAVSSFMLAHGVALLFGIIAFAIGIVLLLRIPPIHYAWHRVTISLPVAGTMVKNYNMVNFARSMSLLLKSGVKIVQAVEITGRSTTNLVYKKVLEKISQEVGHGDMISKYLMLYPRLFPPVFSEMVAVGEQTGKLDDTGIYLADFYENELDDSTKSLSSILEPLLLLFMGTIVGFIAISIIYPIYQISQNINN